MQKHGATLHTALVQWIRSVFQEGLVLTEDVTRFMESAFGTQDIVEVLQSTHDSETGPLLELLCFPDRELQIRFESRWGNYTFTADDHRAVTWKLCRPPLETVVKSLSGTVLGSIVLPAGVLESAVRRLQITWRPPQALAQVIDRCHSGKRGLSIRVQLRNARLPWHPEQLHLMELFLVKMPAGSDTFEESLTFLLTNLSELPPDGDVVDFLIAKKKFYFKSLCSAEDFERRRRSSNMETLMLQGARAAHGTIEGWQQGMRLIDVICRALFGRTWYFQRPAQGCLDVENDQLQKQIQNVIRFLA
jgi:hypothetical protein